MRNPITNFIKHWKKHGFKKTIEQLRFNYIMLETPMSLINKQLMFYHFVLSGLCLGSFSLFYQKNYLWSAILIFFFYIQYYTFKQLLMQREQIKQFSLLQKEVAMENA